MNQAKYPIGLQDFEKIRENGFLYVDKTQLIHQLINSKGYCLFTRPLFDRSQGKSCHWREFFKRKAQNRAVPDQRNDLISSPSRFSPQPFNSSTKFTLQNSPSSGSCAPCANRNSGHSSPHTPPQAGFAQKPGHCPG